MCPRYTFPTGTFAWKVSQILGDCHSFVNAGVIKKPAEKKRNFQNCILGLAYLTLKGQRSTFFLRTLPTMTSDMQKKIESVPLRTGRNWPLCAARKQWLSMAGYSRAVTFLTVMFTTMLDEAVHETLLYFLGANQISMLEIAFLNAGLFHALCGQIPPICQTCPL